MRAIANKVKYIFCNIITQLLGVFIKRDNRVIIIGAWMGNKFADNSRFIFQYLNVNKAKYDLIRVIWITREQSVKNELSKLGYEVYLANSFKGFYFHFKAGVHIVCNMYAQNGKYRGDINGQYSLGARRVQLWHGVPIKGVGATSNEYIMASKNLKYRIKQKLESHRFYKHYIYFPGGWDECYFVSTGPECTRRCIACHKIPSDFIIETGYPRHCECLELLDEEKLVIDKMKNYRKTIFYLPTFRNKNTNYIHPLKNENIINYIDKNNYLWIEKPHAAASMSMHSGNYNDSNVFLLNQKFDLNIILPYIDLLVTDYSSVSYDGVYFDRPIVYYIPDFEDYKAKDRGFMVNFESNIAGIKAENLNQLVHALEEGLSDRYFNHNILENYSKIKGIIYDGRLANYDYIAKKVLGMINS
jgi:CDP-glycerol glycerophosphotransferase (TagB/SpsB family)